MVGRLAVGRHAAEDAARIERGVQYNGLKHHGVQVMRATECGQSSAGFKEFQRAQVDFLVSAHGVGDGGAAAGE